MAEQPKTKRLAVGRLDRLASLARAGIDTAASVVTGGEGGLVRAVERLGELRGLGTKVGQMAGLVEANLSPEVREAVGPALAMLRAQAVRSPYEEIARLIEAELGAPPDSVFASFEHEPFASASLGQVHRAVDHDGRLLAVKVQHPGIERAFARDLANVGALGRVATSFIMPAGQGRRFIEGVREGFLSELDYTREAANLRAFARLCASDPDLVLPEVVDARSSRRVLSTTFVNGEDVAVARDYAPAIRRRQAAAVRRFVLSALTDHGTLYADAHAGNFLFRPDGTVGVLDFGSVFHFDEPRRRALEDFRAALARSDRPAFTVSVAHVLELQNPRAAEAIASMQWLAIGGLVRGDAIDESRVREITQEAARLKRSLLGQRFTLPWFMPFLMRSMIATNALLAALRAPESGPLGSLGRPEISRCTGP
jgi:predicted unusual protein kinase regulating ubiquinone biosynthesis (AarF/ABC1/UbiB family)